MFNYLKKIFLALFSPEKKASLKIVNISGAPSKKDTIVTYQVCGKSISVNDTPGKLVDDLMFLKGFNKEDSEIIYGLAISEKESKNYKINTIIFDEYGSYIKVEDVELNISFNINILDVFKEKNFINNIDANTFSTVLALYYSEHFQNQNNSIRSQKKIDTSFTTGLRIIK